MKVNLTRLINEVTDHNRVATEAEYSDGKIWYFRGKDTLKMYSDVYKLMNKCKMYAISKGYIVSSFFLENGTWGTTTVKIATVDYNTNTDYKTEYEAVFEAIDWIINNELSEIIEN